MQILHAGRYAYHYFPVSASAVKSPIGWGRVPKALSHTEVIETIVSIIYYTSYILYSYTYSCGVFIRRIQYTIYTSYTRYHT